MNEGRVWEKGPPDEVFANPKTPELRQFVASTF
jgi:polar amino acid transport system ATP-binding protein